MEDYVRQSFCELMQRGIEVDVWPLNDVRVLYLSQSRDCFFVALTKQSIAKQEIYLGDITSIRVAEAAGGQPSDDGKRLEIATESLNFVFNVDTQASRDILIRNLIKLVDYHNAAAGSSASTGRSAGAAVSQGRDALRSFAQQLYSTKRGQQMLCVFLLLGCALIVGSGLAVGVTPSAFGFAVGFEVGVGAIGAVLLLAVAAIEVVHRLRVKGSDKVSPRPVAGSGSGLRTTSGKCKTKIYPEISAHAAAP